MMPSIGPSKSLEHRLRLRAEQLRHEIATVRERSEPPEAGEVSDPKDAADAQAQGVVADAEVERDLAELRQIELALRRIDDGSYGICTDCSTPIDPRRVLAQPTALRCVECQAITEGATRIANGHVGPRP
jgi:RNA polymerase-binding protein DksA